MKLHFYTSYDNIQKLREGDDILVWTKECKSPYDIHVSLDMNKYSFDKYWMSDDSGEYIVSLKK